MKVLVTGGTGLVGKAAVDRLLEAGHTVRLLSRHADDDARQWPHGVEPHTGDVSSDAAVAGAAEGCDAVLHAAGIASERPPELTFQAVNVEGTRRLALEAKRAGTRRFVYVSSLGAERGESDYHRSKKAAEDAVRAVAPEGWLILRPGNVYGPGDEVISLLLKMVRALPVVPTIGRGDQPFQPVWHEDLGLALARAVERENPRGVALSLAGPDVTTAAEVVDLLQKLTGKRTLRLPIPEALAKLGVGAAETLGIDVRVTDDQITMLLEGNVLAPAEVNALTDTFGVTPLTLAEGLGRLVDDMPERLPSEGTGRWRGSATGPTSAAARCRPTRFSSSSAASSARSRPRGCWSWAPSPGRRRSWKRGTRSPWRSRCGGTSRCAWRRSATAPSPASRCAGTRSRAPSASWSRSRRRGCCASRSAPTRGPRTWWT
jgi:NADH dehydrogenase